jgi:hypothetical protein
MPTCCELGNRTASHEALNGFKFTIPNKIAEEYYHHIIQMNVRATKSESVPIQWKLLDTSGAVIPLTFLNGSLTTREFTLQVDDNGTTNTYEFICRILAYPRSLPSPRAEFKSFEKFRIYTGYSNSSLFDPKIRYRKQNTDQWTLSNASGIITISDKNDVYEVQAFYENNGEPFLCSPILIVDGHWKKFNMDHHCQIDLADLSLKKIFRAKINFQQSDLIATIQSTDNTIDDNKEIELQKVELSDVYWGIISNYTNLTSPVLLPGQYQLKIIAKNLNITFTHTITVDGDSKEQWPIIFGSNTDAVKYVLSLTEIHEDCDYYGGPVDVHHHFNRVLQLLPKGQYKYDKVERYQNSVYNSAEKNEFGYSGHYRILEENQYRAIVGLSPEVRRTGTSNFTARKSISKENVDDQRQAPAIFLPEIISKISSFEFVGRDRAKLRLVCKKWLNAIPLNLIIVITNHGCTIEDWGIVLYRE